MKLVTIKTISEVLMVKQSTLYSWVHNGSIPFLRLNGLIRFDMEAIEKWVKTSNNPHAGRGLPLRKATAQDIDRIVKNAVDSAKTKEYNPPNGKPGQHLGLRKEV